MKDKTIDKIIGGLFIFASLIMMIFGCLLLRIQTLFTSFIYMTMGAYYALKEFRDNYDGED